MPLRKGLVLCIFLISNNVFAFYSPYKAPVAKQIKIDRKISATEDWSQCQVDLCEGYKGSLYSDIIKLEKQPIINVNLFKTIKQEVETSYRANVEDFSTAGKYMMEVKKRKLKMQDKELLYFLSPLVHTVSFFSDFNSEKKPGDLLYTNLIMQETTPDELDLLKKLNLVALEEFKKLQPFFSLTSFKLSNLTNTDLEKAYKEIESNNNKIFAILNLASPKTDSLIAQFKFVAKRARSVGGVNDQTLFTLAVGLLHQRLFINYIKLTSSNKLSLLNEIDLSENSEFLSGIKNIENDVKTIDSGEWKKEIPNLETQCKAAVNLIEFAFPSKEQIKTINKTLPAKLIQYKKDAAKIFAGIDLPQEKLNRIKAASANSAVHTLTSLSVWLERSNQSNAELKTSKFKTDNDKVLFALMSEKIFNLTELKDQAVRPCKIISDIFPDASNALELTMTLGPLSMSRASEFESVTLHEFGHILRPLLSENSKGEEALKKSRLCLASQHVETSTAFGEYYFEEDFADWFAAKARPDFLNFSCYLINEMPKGSLKLEAEVGDSHSSYLFRAMHAYFLRHKNLPASCTAIRKLNFQNCDLL